MSHSLSPLPSSPFVPPFPPPPPFSSLLIIPALLPPPPLSLLSLAPLPHPPLPFVSSLPSSPPGSPQRVTEAAVGSPGGFPADRLMRSLLRGFPAGRGGSLRSRSSREAVAEGLRVMYGRSLIVMRR